MLCIGLGIQSLRLIRTASSTETGLCNYVVKWHLTANDTCGVVFVHIAHAADTWFADTWFAVCCGMVFVPVAAARNVCWC